MKLLDLITNSLSLPTHKIHELQSGSDTLDFKHISFSRVCGRSLRITGKGYIPISHNRKLSLLVCTSGKISGKNPQSNTTAHQIIADNVSLFVFTAMLLTSKTYRPVESIWDWNLPTCSNNHET